MMHIALQTPGGVWVPDSVIYGMNPVYLECSSVSDLPIFHSISGNIFIRSGLNWGLLSKRIRCGVYTTGRAAHAHYSSIARSESLASRSQIKDVVKLIF